MKTGAGSAITCTATQPVPLLLAVPVPVFTLALPRRRRDDSPRAVNFQKRETPPRNCVYNAGAENRALDVQRISPPSSLPPQAEVATGPDRYESLIDGRLDQTRRHVKWVDVADGAVRLAIGALMYLMLAAVIDQRLISGGLGRRVRLLLRAGLWLGGGVYFLRRLLPHCCIASIRSLPPHDRKERALAEEQPDQLLVAAWAPEVAPVVFSGVERRAPPICRASVTAVDRTHIIRLFCVLAVVVTR